MSNELSTLASTQASVPKGTFELRLSRPAIQPGNLSEQGLVGAQALVANVTKMVLI